MKLLDWTENVYECNELFENVNVYGKIECKQRMITKDSIQPFERLVLSQWV